MKPSHISELKIDPALKRRPGGFVKAIFAGVIAALLLAVYYTWPRAANQRRLTAVPQASAETAPALAPTPPPEPVNTAKAGPASPFVLTVSGYIINRERIELSPRFQGVVKWIGVKQGDAVRKGQVVVLLDDAEQKARLAQARGQLEGAKVALARAELDHRRAKELLDRSAASQEAEDQARLAVDAARAGVAESEGEFALAKTYLDWTVITSPIDGVVLEKLTEPGELVTPQSFGGNRGPSTAVLAVADPRDLQVELDINESDLAKISLGQRAQVSPEAYPEKHYDGVVAEISPEANRQKGTLQIKVQVEHPDRYLTPELTAKVEFYPAGK